MLYESNQRHLPHDTKRDLRVRATVMNVVPITKSRVLLRQASPEKISGEWRRVVDEIISVCKTNLGSHLIAVYIGGSVACGQAIEGKSDVDSYVVVDLDKHDITQAYPQWVEKERKQLDLKFPFQRGVEIHLQPNVLSERNKFRFTVLTALVHGKSLVPPDTKFVLDKETLRRVRVDVAQDITTARTELFVSDDLAEIARIGTWVAKRLIRGAGTLVLWKAEYYTMDVKLLSDLFLSDYPAQRESIGILMDLIEHPCHDKQKVIDILDSFGSWLVAEDKNIFSTTEHV